MRVFSGVEELSSAVGEHLGYSGWHEITQEQVDGFAEATGDRQWIHIDPERAAQGPFGGTIAHGYLTLSLIPALGTEIYRLMTVSMGINYGANKIRFLSPVRVGAKVRAGAELIEVADVPQGKRVTMRYTVEVDDTERPACVAEVIAVMVA